MRTTTLYIRLQPATGFKRALQATLYSAADATSAAMLHITAITAVGATRRALLAAVQRQLPAALARGYSSSGEGSFSIHVPKANRRSSRHEGSSRKPRPRGPIHSNSNRTTLPSSSTQSTSTRNKRVVALRPPENQQFAMTDTSDAALHPLQKAIDGQDIASIWSTWQGSGQVIQNLGSTEHHKLLHLCSAYADGLRDVRQIQQWQPRFRSMAEAASLTGDVDLICGWFRVLLANGQPEDLIQIWERIVRMRIEYGPIGTNTDIAPDTALTEKADGERFVRLDESALGERVEIHDMVCLVAFACRNSSRANDFVDLFDKVEFGSPFRLFLNMTRAKRLFESIPMPKIQAPGSDRIIDWNEVQSELWNIELARGLSSGSGGPQRIARLLGSLFSMRQVDEAYTIFRTAMRAVSQSPPWLSLETPDSDAKASVAGRVKWTESCWSVCLSNFIASGRTDLAMHVWSQFQERQLYPSPRIWNALLDGYGRAKNYTAALQTWSAAIKQALNTGNAADSKLPDELMYTTMINIHFRARKKDEAMTLLSEMIARSDRNGGKLNVQAETFNAAIFGLFINREHEQAQALLDEMLAKGPAPNIGTVNTFLRAYARIGDLQALASTLRLAEKLKLIPDVVTFTTVLDALLRSGGETATDAVAKTLGIMTSMGVQPNVVTYTAMIKACLVGAEAVQLDMASNSMLGDSYKRGGQQAHEASIAAALDLLDRMIEAKIAPSEATYTALIGGCLQNPDAVAHAIATKSIPRQYRALPKPLGRLNESDESIRRWSQESPEVALALLLLEHMKARGLVPPPMTMRHLIEGLCSVRTDQAAFNRSMDLIDDMLLRSLPAEPSRRLGPFVSAVMKGKDVYPPSLHSLSHTTWVVIFGSLIDRLEHGSKNRTSVVACGRALLLATRFVRDMGSLAGSEGGLTLSGLFERASSHISKLRR